MTIRTHDQFNTTIYGLDDRYRGIKNGRRVIFMNKDDIYKYDLQEGQYIDIINRTGEVERVAKQFKIVKYSIPCGSVATYFPEANVLIPLESIADKSHTPTSKSIPVKIVPTSNTI